ncbi:MAG: serpin family protein [Bacteroides sp.]|nr:serpin family protein [Bacteroides sp.]
MLTAMATGCSSDTASDILPENPQTPQQQEENGIKAPISPDNEINWLTLTQEATTVDLIKTIIGASERTENVVFSPFSIYTAMSMMANATDGDNLKEILAFLHITDQGEEIRNRCASFPIFPPSGQEDKALEFINRNNARLIDNIPYLDADVTFKMANSVWTDNGFDIRPQFSDIMASAYKAPTFTHNFATENVCELINGWVSEKTDNLIPQLMTQPISGPLALTTAMYFKGLWNQPFDPQYTTKETFTCSDGSQVQVDMMHHQKVKAYLGEAYGGYTLTLTFGNNLYYISFLLPAPGADIPQIVEDLNLGKFQLWELVTEYGETEVFLPKFSVKANYDLCEILSSLGVNGIFSPTQWNALTDSTQPLYLQNAIHTTAFSIDETGGEGASSSGLALGGGHLGIPVPLPERIFRVDHPFIFTVMEFNCDIPLLVGCINKL